jgi:hypothetical protein
MNNLDDDRNAAMDRARTIKTPVNITTDGDGEPEIPSITKDDGYHTKVVQIALRNYFKAHIRGFYSSYCI